MTQARYVFCKDGRYYFRRRITGFPQKSKPLMVSLGCKDKQLAYLAAQKLLTEYETMLNAFIYLHPPLPDDLVATYLSVQLRQLVRDMQRDLRQARMIGRASALSVKYLELQRYVLEVMIECGIEKAFPVRRIDPTWSKQDLETVMQIFERERQNLLSKKGEEKLFQDFVKATGAEGAAFISREHECQVREAYLMAKLAAIDASREAPTVQIKVARKKAKALVLKEAQKDHTPVILNSKQDVKRVTEAPKPTQEAPSRLTIRALITMQDAAQAAKSDGTYSSDIASIFWRMAHLERLSKDVTKQRASDLRLFSLVTGIVDVQKIEQHHLSQYRDALGRIPKTFLRSEKDQDLTLKDLMARSELLHDAEVGLSSSTISRHLKSLELMLHRTKSEGHTLNPDLDLSRLKPKARAKTPAHRRRSVFRVEELGTVFGHTAWTGCAGPRRRHDAGDQIIKDSRYWVPLILAYTGARRAEIAGLMSNDIENIDGIPCFHIRSNAYRGIKGEGEQAEKSRIVPLHPHLTDLGLLEHAARQKDGLMFPDVLPRSRKKSKGDKPAIPAKIGDSLDDFWRKTLRITLEGNPRKLCMHSLRHYVNNQLIHSSGIHEVTRLDLLGHVDSGAARQSINTSTYRDETGVREKLQAITALPCLF